MVIGLTEEINKKREAFNSELNKIPGVDGFSYSNGTVGNVRNGLYDEIDDKVITMKHLNADENFIDLFGIEILEGKEIPKEAKTEKRNKYYVNEAGAKSLNVENIYDLHIWGMDCIGIVKDFNFSSLQNNIQPLIITINDLI